jgi:hypothetical protein
MLVANDHGPDTVREMPPFRVSTKGQCSLVRSFSWPMKSFFTQLIDFKAPTLSLEVRHTNPAYLRKLVNA